MTETLPPPDALLDRCRALCALDAALHPGDDLNGFARVPLDRAEAFVTTNGGGDWAVVLHSGPTVAIRCFDHEADNSPYTDDEERPDPSLLVGCPDAARALVEQEVLGLLAHERTFVAWWTGAGWEHRGPDSHPLERFLVEAAQIVEWMHDEGWQLDEAQVAEALAGRRDPSTLDRRPRPEPEHPFQGLWSPGDPFELQLVPAKPVQSTPVLKVIRAETGGSLGEIRHALAHAEPVFTATLARHAYGEVGLLGSIRQIVDALGPVGGTRFVVRVGEEVREVTEDGFRQLIGGGRVFYD
ncbi:MAG: hypothetical protein R3F61_38365 [Myxococcota bacterium]